MIKREFKEFRENLAQTKAKNQRHLSLRNGLFVVILIFIYFGLQLVQHPNHFSNFSALEKESKFSFSEMVGQMRFFFMHNDPNLYEWQYFIPAHGFESGNSIDRLNQSQGEWKPLQELKRNQLGNHLWIRIEAADMRQQCERLNSQSWQITRPKQTENSCDNLYLFSGKWTHPLTIYNDRKQILMADQDTNLKDSHLARFLRWKWIPIKLPTEVLYFAIQINGNPSEFFMALPWISTRQSVFYTIFWRNLDLLIVIALLFWLFAKIGAATQFSKFFLSLLTFTFIWIGLLLMEGIPFLAGTIVSFVTIINVVLFFPLVSFFYVMLFRRWRWDTWGWKVLVKTGSKSFFAASYLLLCLLVSIIVLVSPWAVYFVYFVLPCCLVILLMYSMIFVSHKKHRWQLGGLLLLTIAIVHQAVYTWEIPLMLPQKFVLWAGIFFIYFLTTKMVAEKDYRDQFLISYLAYKRKISFELAQLNQSYSRFVPMEFVRILQKEKITEVALGDNIEIKVTIMVTDMHSFTTFSEKMSPSENFRFVNSYLDQVGPVIRSHYGFVMKFLGDGLMAVFPAKPEDAIHAAIKIQKNMIHYNEYRKKKNRQAVLTGIGIHTGVVRLGTVGEVERIQGDIISDAANLASRIEGLTREYGATILMSQDTKMELEEYSDFDMRTLDRVKVKGKNKETKVIEVLSSQIDPYATLKISSKSTFEDGFRALYFDKKYLHAVDCFEAVLRENPNDSSAQVLMDRATYKVLNESGLQATH